MAKIGCACGNVIVDQTDNIPYKAIFIRDQDFDNYYDYTEDVSSFIKAIKSGRSNEWVREYFSYEYPADIDESSIIFDIIGKYALKVEKYIYQCESCGRMYVQIKDTNRYASFKPEDEDCKGIFKRFEK